MGALWRVRGVGRLALAVWGGVRIGSASGADALGVRSRGTIGGRGRAVEGVRGADGAPTPIESEGVLGRRYPTLPCE